MKRVYLIALVMVYLFGCYHEHTTREYKLKGKIYTNVLGKYIKGSGHRYYGAYVFWTINSKDGWYGHKTVLARRVKFFHSTRGYDYAKISACFYGCTKGSAFDISGMIGAGSFFRVHFYLVNKKITVSDTEYSVARNMGEAK